MSLLYARGAIARCGAYTGDFIRKLQCDSVAEFSKCCASPAADMPICSSTASCRDDLCTVECQVPRIGYVHHQAELSLETM